MALGGGPGGRSADGGAARPGAGGHRNCARTRRSFRSDALAEGNAVLFGVGATDLLTFAVAPLGMMRVILATFVPALRSTRVSQVVALRYK